MVIDIQLLTSIYTQTIEIYNYINTIIATGVPQHNIFTLGVYLGMYLVGDIPVTQELIPLSNKLQLHIWILI